MQATAFTYSPDTRSGSVLLDDGTPVPFDADAFDAGGLRLLRAAAAHPRAFLADTQLIGTTLLAAGPGVPLGPAFGGASRLRHAASGARELAPAGVPSVRRDVDTPDDLRVALDLGTGPRTTALSALADLCGPVR